MLVNLLLIFLDIDDKVYKQKFRFRNCFKN